MLTFRGPRGIVVLRSASSFKGFRFQPLRPKFNVAINGTLHHVLLSSLRNCTVAAIGMTNISRRFTTVPNIVRSVLGVVLGLGRIHFVHAISGRSTRGISVGITNIARLATKCVSGCLSFFGILGPSLIVYRLTPNAGVRVALAVNGNHNCMPTRRGAPTRYRFKALPVSSVFAPVGGIGCSVRGCHIRRGASCRGLGLRVAASKSVRPGRTLGRTTGVLVRRFVLFSSRGVAIGVRSAGNTRRFSRSMLRVHRLLGAGLSSRSLDIHTLGYLGTTSISAIKSLIGLGHGSLLGFHGFNGGSLARLSRLLASLGLGFNVSMSVCGLSGSWL